MTTYRVRLDEFGTLLFSNAVLLYVPDFPPPPCRQRRADAAGCPVLHAVLAGQGAHQRRAAVRGADRGARLQYTSHHASIPNIQLPQLRRRKATCRLRKYNLLFSGGWRQRRRIVIFPGHVVVMAGPAAVIAKEVRKEICRNNKSSAKKKIPSTAAATQRGPVKRNQSTLWNPLFLADHRRLVQLRESKNSFGVVILF